MIESLTLVRDALSDDLKDYPHEDLYSGTISFSHDILELVIRGLGVFLP